MPSRSPDTSKRIAKNTLMLYVRMLFMMGVSLYTSRIVLSTLGVVDYGINNVVGGVIVMLSFLNNSLSGASSRFITVSLGKGDATATKRTFGNILSIHFLLAGIVFIVGETIGLWFVTTQLQIPAGRETAAFWVYQFSVFSMMMSIISVPYTSAIIAHERMSAFAYISIADALLKLVVVYLLVAIPYDKLIVYASLYFCISLFDRLVYGIYSARHFPETKARPRFDKKLSGEVFAFAGWTLNGNLAVIGFTQGLNMLLNIFFGPAVNAARGIAVQVQTIVQQFCDNFQTAINPQLIKSYAQGDLSYMQTLLVRSSKFSFFILFFIALPLMFEAKFVLNLWLGIVPEHTVNFLRLVIVVGMLHTLANPMITSVHATGRLRKFQIVEGTMLLTIVPISYVLLKFFGVRPEWVFAVHIAVETVTQYARAHIVLPMIGMPLWVYFHQVVIPVLVVSVISPLIPYLLYVNTTGSIANFFAVCTSCVLCISLIILFLGCTKAERNFVVERVRGVVGKLKGI